jgi:Glycosyl transferase family 2
VTAGSLSAGEPHGVAIKTVSIIIPCYNAAGTLAETIESALGQDYPRIEVIAVDDGSTDRTLEVLRGYEPRIRVLTGPNAGVSAARDTGFAVSTGEAIVFLDSDDIFANGAIAAAMRVMEAAAADVVLSEWVELRLADGVWTDGQRLSIKPEQLGTDPEAAIALDVWAPPAAVLYSRRIVERIGGFRRDLPVIQDARFLFDAAHHGGRFAHASHLGARYRITPSSLSRRDPGRFWVDVLNNARQMEALWTAKLPLSQLRTHVLERIYTNCALSLYKVQRPELVEALRGYRRYRQNSFIRVPDTVWLWSRTAWSRRPSIRKWLIRK